MVHASYKKTVLALCLMASSCAQAISRTEALIAAATLGAGGGALGGYVAMREQGRRSGVKVFRMGAGLATITSFISGLILYQYTPGPRYDAAKVWAANAERCALATTKCTVINVDEIMEMSGCFKGTIVIPPVLASQKLEELSVVLDNAEYQLICARSDEPDTPLRTKIIELLATVESMQVNVQFNQRFIKSRPEWHHAISMYNQQAAVMNQAMMANAAQMHASAAGRSSWALVMMTIADWVRLISGNDNLR